MEYAEFHILLTYQISKYDVRFLKSVEDGLCKDCNVDLLN